MGTPFNKYDVGAIKSKILNPALTSHFYVQIGFPQSARGFLNDNIVGGVNPEQLNLLCSEANLPGSSFNTHENNNDYVGVTERFAYRRVYDDRIELTFYVDADKYTPIRFFESWMKYISGETVRDSSSPYSSYKFKYPDDPEKGYRGDFLSIYKFERSYTNWISYKFVGVYPISIVSMPISYDASSLLKCTVHMTYLRYIISPNINQKAPTTSFPPSLSQELPKFDSGLNLVDLANFNSNFTSVTDHQSPNNPIPFITNQQLF